jgi:hypothetical protein
MATTPPALTGQVSAVAVAARRWMASSVRTPRVCVAGRTRSGPFVEVDSSRCRGGLVPVPRRRLEREHSECRPWWTMVPSPALHGVPQEVERCLGARTPASWRSRICRIAWRGRERHLSRGLAGRAGEGARRRLVRRRLDAKGCGGLRRGSGAEVGLPGSELSRWLAERAERSRSRLQRRCFASRGGAWRKSCRGNLRTGRRGPSSRR